MNLVRIIAIRPSVCLRTSRRASHLNKPSVGNCGFVSQLKEPTIGGLPGGNSGNALLVRELLRLYIAVNMRARLPENRTSHLANRPRFSVFAFRLAGRGIF